MILGPQTLAKLLPSARELARGVAGSGKWKVMFAFCLALWAYKATTYILLKRE